MRIVMAVNDLYLIDRRILQEARTLVRQGHSVHLFAGFECAGEEEFIVDGISVSRHSFDWSDPRFGWISRLPRFRGLRRLAHIATAAWIRYWAEMQRFDRFVVDLICSRGCDLLHVHDLPLLKPGVLAARRLGVPLIYDAHEIYDVHAEFPAKTRRRMRQLEKKYVHRVDQMITVNEFLAEIFARRYQIPLPAVLYNASELYQIGDRSVLKRRLGLEDDIRLVVYQGWMPDHRGLDTLVRAVPWFASDIHLVFIGYGQAQASLEELVAELGCLDRVHFLGKVEPEDLPALTVGADLGVIPYQPIDENHLYCSPNKLFEFISAEVPVMANDLPFLRKIIVGHGIGDVVAFDDGASLAAAVNAAFAEGRVQAWRARLSVAKHDLSWDHEAAKLLDLYQRLCCVPATPDVANKGKEPCAV